MNFIEQDYKLMTQNGLRTVQVKGDRITDEFNEVNRFVYSHDLNQLPKLMFYKDDQYKFVMLFSFKYREFVGRSSLGEVKFIPEKPELYDEHENKSRTNPDSFVYVDQPPVDYSFEQYERPLEITVEHKHAVVVPLYAPATGLQTLDALEDAKDVDVHVFAMPVTNFDEVIQGEQVQAAEEKGFNVIRLQKDIGYGRLLIYAYEQLFSRGYTEVTVVYPNVDFTSNVFQLMTRARMNGPDNLGIIQAWKHELEPDKEYADTFEAVYKQDLRVFCMSHKVYLSIKEHLLKYRELFLKGRYENRPHRSIRKWLETFTGTNFVTSKDGLIPSQTKMTHRRDRFADPGTSIESILIILTDFKGWVRVAPLYSRVVLLDDKSNPQDYKTLKYAKMELKTFANDGRRKNFDWKG